MLLFLLFFPLAIGGLVFILPGQKSRNRMLIFTALLHSACVFSFWKFKPAFVLNGFLGLDALGLLILSVVSVLFLMVSFYLMGYFKNESDLAHRIFIGFLLFFLSFMTLVTVSRHFGLLLIGIEATTLSSVPLINFVKTRQSIEATWKFLMICLIGIALALLGTYFLAVAGMDNAQSLFLDKLLIHAKELSLPWFKMSVIFLLIGCGTKMGLAPMHPWLPDAHSQAPSPVSALLSGCLLNCAFLSVLRVGQVCFAAGQTQFFSSILILLGIISLGVAYVFILGQEDYKRMFAYSSVEHMGILAIGIGLGGAGIYGSLLHVINNAFTKGFVFLVTGNLYKQYHSKKVSEVKGVLRAYPITGIFLLAGLLAVSGVPPFGTFISELMILYAAVRGHHYVVAFLYCLFLALIFIGIADIILKMIQGGPVHEPVIQSPNCHPERSEGSHICQDSSPFGLRMTNNRESWSMIMPILFLIVIVLILGFYIPPFLDNMLQKASGLLGG